VRVAGIRADPYFTFDAYMDACEEASLKATFYFIADHTGGDVDGNYRLSDSYIRNLLSTIHARGHEIGLHPSYHTYLDEAQLGHEFSALREACEQLGIRQDHWSGRQHYLRWHPTTARNFARVGLDSDATLTFAARAGFRAGVCYEYPAFDLETRRPLRLAVRPLVVMDVSMLGEHYMALSPKAAHATLSRLRANCHAFAGDFSVLWHNSSLNTPEEWQLFRSCLTRPSGP
jgi:peptidoglycan/xylan/chitin deacetylase (PgdA/CDA1 family)